MTNELKQVKTRRVYYISGFDPRGVRHYHRLYRDEAAKEAARRGYEISVGAKTTRPDGDVGWAVDSAWPDGKKVHTDYRFMVWDDIVRNNWQKNLLPLLGQCLIGYGRYFAAGVLAGISHSHRGAYFSVLFPIVFLTLWVASFFVVLASWIALCVLYMPSWIVGVLGIAALSIIVMWLGQKLGEILGVFWLMRSILYTEKWGSVGDTELEERIDSFASRLSKDMAENPVDEVLLIGHSSGSMIAPLVASRYLRDRSSGDKLTLITIGHCLPLMALIPAAEAYRNEVVALTSDSRIQWFDISAKADPLGFFDENPALVCKSPELSPGIAKMFHVRIFRMFTPATYKKLKNNKPRLHFQYLMSAELETGYDYFQLTAGPLPAASILEPQ